MADFREYFAHCPDCGTLFRTDRGFDGRRRYHCSMCFRWYTTEEVVWKPCSNTRTAAMRAKMAGYERTLLNNKFKEYAIAWEEQLLSLCASESERIMLRCLAVGREFTNTMFDILTLPEAPDETT